MGQTAQRTWIDYDAYLALERETDRKHEWCNGEVRAMAGGTPAHSGLAGNIIHELRRLLGDRPCVVHSADLKIRVAATGLATYADAAVVCGEPALDAQDRNAVTNPLVLVEVLSDSTESYDRGAKFAHYRALASLRAYVLVSQREARVEVYSRDEQNRWVLQDAVAGGSVPVGALDGSLEVDRVYRGITLQP